METVCAFTNTVGLGGGYIVCGVSREDQSLFPFYTVSGVPDPDQLQSDLASQCASVFNRPIRPSIKVEKVNGLNVIVVKIDEASSGGKPIYFKNQKLPAGALIRIGSADVRCTEEDLEMFYADREDYDASCLDYTSIADIDTEALRRYRALRSKVNPEAAELQYDDEELLLSLNCLADDGSGRLTVAGLLIFGKSSTLRRKFPMQRVDYIRVAGTRWMEDPDDRFTSIDMRGPLILLASRALDSIYGDLPKAFKLEEGAIQAEAKALPARVLREAVVNALIHRNYRISGPIQFLRYDNRLELINPGFSLKPEAQLGEQGSRLRNPTIAAVFHETNLAETKGSGIQTMRKLLDRAEFAPPTFESDRTRNQFTSRLLLHHFFKEDDLRWLGHFTAFELNDRQKPALVFLREVGAIDSSAYRQFTDATIQQAGLDLRQLRQLGLLTKKGRTRDAYYVPGPEMVRLTTQPAPVITQPLGLTTEPAPPTTEPTPLTTEPDGASSAVKADTFESRAAALPEEVRLEISGMGMRARDKEVVTDLIVKLCSFGEWTRVELARLLSRDENFLYRTYLYPMLQEGRLEYTIPEVKNHPEQAYRAATKGTNPTEK